MILIVIDMPGRRSEGKSMRFHGGSIAMGTENHPWCEARFAAAFLPPLVLFCIGGFAAAGDEVPKASIAVGLSNRPDDFKKMQQEVEPLVGKLAGEKSEGSGKRSRNGSSRNSATRRSRFSSAIANRS